MEFNNNRLSLSLDPLDNTITHDGHSYLIQSSNGNDPIGKGGNGLIYDLFNEEGENNLVIKISKFHEGKSSDFIKTRLDRFQREIEALEKARENELQNIVRLEFHGTLNASSKVFPYYVMQKCDCNLKEYLNRDENKIDDMQKTLLCQKILLAISGLNEYRIYHRDIKHENILFIGDEPFVADLGLSDYLDSDILIDEFGELIGPTGWFSPEAINKHYLETTKNRFSIDCKIDSKSEVFQLGKLFWYIYQGNLPIGQIDTNSFEIKDETLFKIIFNMLKYSKEERSDSTKVLSQLKTYLSH